MGNESKYQWEYCSVGGVVRVKIEKGDDIAHLNELDQKMWTVLSCPVKGLAMDARTLAVLDADSDGKVRVKEVVAAARWLTSVLKDRDSILRGEDSLKLDNFDCTSPEGKTLHDSAIQILSYLGKPESDSISIADSSDSVAIFAKTLFNGDGVITEATAGDDAQLKDTIAAVAASVGTAPDRSGVPGVTAEQIEAFYAALADYSAWQAEADADKAAVLPYGDATSEAYAACEALKDKMADYFMRCKLVKFDGDAAPAVDVSVEKIGQISSENLAGKADVIATYPLARPTAEAILQFDGINPAWQTAFNKMRSLVLDGFDYGISEEQWISVLAGFDRYTAWKAAARGLQVAGLGNEKIAAFISADRKADLLALVEQDEALSDEASAIDSVDKLLHLHRHFYDFLKNYVIMADFYDRCDGRRGMFEAGELYVDQRCCNLCIKVEDMSRHADMAALSGMFLIYCNCVSKTKGETMDIVAVLTDGSIKGLRPGKNAVFYDRSGQDWDATITKIVDNPINIKNAFWSPYRKFWEFCIGIINKSAAEKENKVTADLQQTASTAIANPGEPAAAKTQAFDIAKFAGIFAALGMGLGMLADALVGVFKGIVGLEWWQLLAIIVGIIVIISGPSCFIAWTKLRKRNLGPVLNANGWAINSVLLVNTIFGAKLTKVAKYPMMKLDDPFAPKVPVWKKILRWIVFLLAVTFGVLFFMDKLNFLGLHRQKVQDEVVVAADDAAPAENDAGTPAEAVLE